MSKLRVVKERRSEVSSNDTDLRGLANKGLLENEYPWIYLIVHNSQAEHTNAVCEHLKLQHRAVPAKQTEIIYDAHKSKNHKSKSITLFGALILIAKLNPESSMLIGQLDVLKYKIQNLDLRDLPELKTAEVLEWPQATGVSRICNPIDIYLNHAGFKISMNSNYYDLSNADVSKIAPGHETAKHSKTG